MLALGGVVLCGVLAGACASNGSDDESRANERTASAPGARDGGAAATDRGTGGAAPSARHGARLLLLGRFGQPVYLAAPPGDTKRRFVVERPGRIVIVRGGRTLKRPFLDISGQVDTEGEGDELDFGMM